jgi:hypothetical protein
VYIGRITHKGDSCPGQHEAIVDQALWEQTSALLATQNRGRRQTGGKVDTSMLTGLLYDADGNRYTPTHAVKGGKRYRYYTSQAAIQKRGRSSQFNRLPAKEVEQLVVSRVAKLFDSPEELIQAVADVETPTRDLQRLTAAGRDLARSWNKLSLRESGSKIRSFVGRVLVGEAALEIEVSPEALERMLLSPDSGNTEPSNMHPKGSKLFSIRCPLTTTRSRGELRLIVPGFTAPSNQVNRPVLKALARATRWRERIMAGEVYCKEQIAADTGLNASYVGKILRLSALSPDIVEDVIAGSRAEFAVTGTSSKVPLDWSIQRREVDGRK